VLRSNLWPITLTYWPIFRARLSSFPFKIHWISVPAWRCRTRDSGTDLFRVTDLNDFVVRCCSITELAPSLDGDEHVWWNKERARGFDCRFTVTQRLWPTCSQPAYLCNSHGRSQDFCCKLHSIVASKSDGRF